LSVRGRLLNGILGLRAALLPRRRFPPYLAPFGGWTWWNLSHAAARFALGFADAHPDYRAYHEHTLSADELFFPSILCGTGFAEEHEIVNDCLRYMDWPERTSHPRTLGTGDVPAMLASGKPFARKFDLGTDPGVVDALRGTPGMGTEGV
jgi:hypothetical protein